MGHNTTAPQLTSALRASFCRSGVPDTFWFDQGPQFTSKTFQDFAKQWGFEHITSSPTYPQSNGKAEAAIKSMKNLICIAWTGRYLDENKLTQALHYSNTGILHHGKTDCLPHRNCSVNPSRTHYQPIGERSQPNGNVVQQTQNGKLLAQERPWRSLITVMQNPSLTLSLDPKWLSRTTKQNDGIPMAQ